jgi:hypothetical protein
MESVGARDYQGRALVGDRIAAAVLIVSAPSKGCPALLHTRTRKRLINHRLHKLYTYARMR